MKLSGAIGVAVLITVLGAGTVHMQSLAKATNAQAVARHGIIACPVVTTLNCEQVFSK